MRKLYSIIAAALLMFPASLMAQTMTEENAILDQEGYRLEKDVNFRDGFVNGKEIVPNNGLQFGVTEDYKINNYQPQRVTNEGLEFMSIQLAGNGIDLVNGQGLKSIKNERWIVINDLREGQIVAFDISGTEDQFVANSNACNGNTGWADTFVDPLIVEEISGSIHELQEIAAGNTGAEGETSAADTYRYYKVINNGAMFAKFNGKQVNYIYRMQIWSPKGEAEVVSTPSLKLTKVNGDARSLEFKAGESTLNKACTTWYGIVDRGEVALFLEDTEEIDHYEYEYQYDGEGNIVYENDEPVIISQTPVYKKKFTDEALTSGEYGANMYNPEDGSIDVYASDDEDGDGFVEIQAATVSETGMFSDVITLRVSVGEITLNAPTLTLTGINGDRRTYTVSWTNNTLCGEDWQIYVTGDDEEVAVEYDLNTIGEPVTVTKNITAVVRVEGYTDGVYTIDEVEGKGIDMRLSEVVGNGENEAHNWDFQNLSEGTLAKINLQVVDHYAVLDAEGNELRTYTVEQEANEQIPEDDLGVIVAVPQYFGWDGADSRNAARHWRTWIPTYEEDEQGNPTTTIVSSTYAEDLTGMFNGLVVDNTHDSYSTMAIFTDASGLFFMSRGTVEVSGLNYGEYVMTSSSAGTSVEQYLDATGAPLSLGFGNGVYLYSIDVFTYDSLPDAINAVENGLAKKGLVYSIDGRIVNRNGQINGLQKGLYIINGQKVMVK